MTWEFKIARLSYASYCCFYYRVVEKAISSVIGHRLFGEDETSEGEEDLEPNLINQFCEWNWKIENTSILQEQKYDSVVFDSSREQNNAKFGNWVKVGNIVDS